MATALQKAYGRAKRRASRGTKRAARAKKQTSAAVHGAMASGPEDKVAALNASAPKVAYGPTGDLDIIDSTDTSITLSTEPWADENMHLHVVVWKKSNNGNLSEPTFYIATANQAQSISVAKPQGSARYEIQAFLSDQAQALKGQKHLPNAAQAVHWDIHRPKSEPHNPPAIPLALRNLSSPVENCCQPSEDLAGETADHVKKAIKPANYEAQEDFAIEMLEFSDHWPSAIKHLNVLGDDYYEAWLSQEELGGDNPGLRILFKLSPLTITKPKLGIIDDDFLELFEGFAPAVTKRAKTLEADATAQKDLLDWKIENSAICREMRRAINLVDLQSCKRERHVCDWDLIGGKEKKAGLERFKARLTTFGLNLEVCTKPTQGIQRLELSGAYFKAVMRIDKNENPIEFPITFLGSVSPHWQEEARNLLFGILLTLALVGQGSRKLDEAWTVVPPEKNLACETKDSPFIKHAIERFNQGNGRIPTLGEEGTYVRYQSHQSWTDLYHAGSAVITDSSVYDLDRKRRDSTPEYKTLRGNERLKKYLVLRIFKTLKINADKTQSFSGEALSSPMATVLNDVLDQLPDEDRQRLYQLKSATEFINFRYVSGQTEVDRMEALFGAEGEDIYTNLMDQLIDRWQAAGIPLTINAGWHADFDQLVLHANQHKIPLRAVTPSDFEILNQYSNCEVLKALEEETQDT